MVADEVVVVATAVEDTAVAPTLRRLVVVEGAATVAEEEVAVDTAVAGKGAKLEKQEHQRYTLTL